MSQIIVKTATPAEEDACMATVVLAFSLDPAARWLYPDPQAFTDHFPAFARAFGAAAFEHGTAHYTEGYKSVALWLPPGVDSDVETLMNMIGAAADPAELDDLMGVLEEMGTYHPTEPHWYLPLIGTDPIAIGSGHGSALLRHATAICDREGLPAYLESSNPRNIGLYRRHGFEVMGKIQRGKSPTITPMLRRPR